MSPQHPEVVFTIKSWLFSNHKRIESFGVGAEWDRWARYELYMALESALGSRYLVTHGVSEIWQGGDGEVDVLLEPRDNTQSIVAIALSCEKVNENEGSYERFRDQMDADITTIKGFGSVESTFEGTRLLLVGFSGEPSVEDAEFKVQPQPEHFVEGEVHCWVASLDLPSAR